VREEVPAHNMTLGECHRIESDSMKMVDGKWESVYVSNKPKPMSTKVVGGSSEAGRYYTAKMNQVFCKPDENSNTKVTLNVNRERMKEMLKEAYEAGKAAS